MLWVLTIVMVGLLGTEKGTYTEAFPTGEACAEAGQRAEKILGPRFVEGSCTDAREASR